MKFTEEQYQQIVEAWNEGLDWRESVDAILKVVRKMRLYSGVSYGRAIALGNPATREWAHKQFVYVEKKYVWTSKKPFHKNLHKRLFMTQIGKYVSDVAILDSELENNSADEHLTETEVRNYGYDPDWFNKEEVK